MKEVVYNSYLEGLEMEHLHFLVGHLLKEAEDEVGSSPRMINHVPLLVEARDVANDGPCIPPILQRHEDIK